MTQPTIHPRLHVIAKTLQLMRWEPGQEELQEHFLLDHKPEFRLEEWAIPLFPRDNTAKPMCGTACCIAGFIVAANDGDTYNDQTIPDHEMPMAIPSGRGGYVSAVVIQELYGVSNNFSLDQAELDRYHRLVSVNFARQAADNLDFYGEDITYNELTSRITRDLPAGIAALEAFAAGSHEPWLDGLRKLMGQEYLSVDPSLAAR